MNVFLTPRLDLEGDGGIAQPGDIFVVFVFARDPSRGGVLREIAIGFIDAEYERFLAYETIEAFLAAYAPSPADVIGSSAEGLSLVSLKKRIVPFRPLASSDSDESAVGSAS